MAEIVKGFITLLTKPEILITVSVLAFVVFFWKLELFTRPIVALGALAGGIVFFLASVQNEHFRSIVTKPDNIPIVLLLLFVGFFFWNAMRQAVQNDKRIREGKPVFEADDKPDKVLVWPHLVYIELICMVLLTVGLLVWSVFIKAPLEQPANPSETPNPSKAPWYFLGLQEMLVYYDPWLAGVVFPGLIIVGLIAIPYIDRNPKGSGYYTFEQRKFAIMTFCFGFFILWVLLINLGTFLRGPNWNFFGPYETWDIHKLVPLSNINLSEYVWVKWANTRLPDEWYIREAPGFLLIGAYLLFLPPILAKTLFRRFFAQLGFVRYNVMVFLFLSMMALPIKMVLRWTINLKYLVAIPEKFFNI